METAWTYLCNILSVEMPEGMGKDTHNPMYDAIAAAMAYRHYLGYRGCYKEYLCNTSNPCTQHAFGCGYGVYMKCTVCENALACRLRHTELRFETFERRV